MKAAVHTGRQRLELQDLPIPRISDTEYLIRTEACAICGSDARWWASEATNKVQGHESVGTVVQAGKGTHLFSEGQRVLPYVMVGCGTCAFCLRGEYIYCYQIKGITTGFAQYQVFEERYLLAVPDRMNSQVATLLGDTLGTALRAVRKAGLKGGETAVVNGLGPLGLVAVQALVLHGAETVIGIDLLDNRCRAAREMGATLTLKADGQSKREEVFALTRGCGAHVVINTVNSAEAAADAFNLLRGGGKLVLIAGACSAYGAQAGIRGQSERQVIGSFYFAPSEYEQNLRLVTEGRIALDRLVSHVYPLERINEAFAMRFQSPNDSLKVVVSL
jgi:threonine dehydrogenase-like Zn-dependent dehydrogenase